MRRLRLTGIVVCSAAVVLAVGTIVADRNEARDRPPEESVPSFSVASRCADARDELGLGDLRYELAFERSRWTAQITLDLVAEGLRGRCDVELAVPPGSVDVARDAGPRVVTLDRDGSPAAGTAAARVDEDGPPSQTFTMEVMLPLGSGLSRSLGIGKHELRFGYFGSPGASPSGKGSVEMRLPPSHSFFDAAPDPRGRGRATPRFHEWRLRVDGDFEAAVVFQDDRVRAVVDRAPQVLFGGVAILLLLLSISPRRTQEPEPEPEETPTDAIEEPAPPPPATPVAALPPPPADERPRPRRRRYVWLGLLAIPVIGRLLRRRRR